MSVMDGARAVVAALAVAGMVAGAGLASEDEAAAALDRTLASNEALLTLLEGVDGTERFDAEADRIAAAVAAARADQEALGAYAADLEGSAELQAEYAPRLGALFARRQAVLENLEARLDPRAYADLTRMFDAPR